MKRIRIAFIIDQLLVGGTERQLLDLIRGLNPDRYAVQLICLRDSPTFEVTPDIPSRIVLAIHKLLSPHGLRQILRLSRLLRNEDVHIVQTFFFDSTVVGVLASALARSPIVISSRRDLAFWATRRLRIVLTRLDRWVDYYLANSSAIKEYLIQEESVSPEKIHVIHNGVDPHAFSVARLPRPDSIKDRLGIPPNHAIIGIVANLNRHVKRVDVFIRAAALVHKHREDAVFLVVGDGALKGQLIELSQELGIEKSVLWAGAVADVAPLISILDIGVLSSDSEGFPNVLLEYMAAGVPAVVTDVGGNRDIIREGVNGLLVPPNDPAALASAIRSLLDDPRRCAHMKTNTRKTAESFSRSSMIAKHESFYESLVSRLPNRGCPNLPLASAK